MNYITTVKAAKILGVSRQFMTRLVKANPIPGKRFVPRIGKIPGHWEIPDTQESLQLLKEKINETKKPWHAAHEGMFYNMEKERKADMEAGFHDDSYLSPEIRDALRVDMY